jgi:hypothetical protein
MVNEHTLGRIVDIDTDGTATIRAVLPNLNRALDRKYSDVEIILPDGRKISPQQRRKCYALLGEIAEYINGIRSSETVEDTKQMMKFDFILKMMESQERKMFSLANCDVSTAREFITYLIDFIIKNDIPSSVSLLDNCEDISRYIYACLVNRKCCICGKHADLHHVDAVGSGNNRNEIHHLGRLALPLCREHHIASHKAGQQSFMAKYHLEPIALDEKLCKIYGLKK